MKGDKTPELIEIMDLNREKEEILVGRRNYGAMRS
jgi:hypothetical protein